MFGKRFAAGNKRQTHPFGRGCCAEQHPRLREIHDIGPARRRFYFNIVLNNNRVGIIISLSFPSTYGRWLLSFVVCRWGASESRDGSGSDRGGKGRSMMSAAMDARFGLPGVAIHGR